MSKICSKNEVPLVCFDDHRKIFLGGAHEAIADEHFSIKDRMADGVRLRNGVLEKTAIRLDIRMKLYDMLFPFVGEFNFAEWRLKSLHVGMVSW